MKECVKVVICNTNVFQFTRRTRVNEVIKLLHDLISLLQQQNRLQHTLTTNASSLPYIGLENQPCYEDPSRTMLELLDK